MASCIITCVYTPTKRLADAAVLSLTATAAEFPGVRRLACIDHASAEVLSVCDALGWELVHPTKDAPPRMCHLLERAVQTCPDADLYWVIEHDTLIQHGTAARIEPHFARYPSVGIIEVPSTDANGKANYPSSYKRYSDFAGRDVSLHRQHPWTSLNCVCIRGDAMRMIEWARIREYPITDQDIHAQLVEDGWAVCASPDVACIHMATWSRKALPPKAPPMKPKAETRPPYKLGVVLPVRNEGGEVLKTVRNFRASKATDTDLRFAIIDDASSDGCCDIFANAQDITLFRNGEAQGEARARNRGAVAVLRQHCDCVFWFDAHERIDKHGLERMANLALEKKALVCAVCRNMNPKGPDPVRVGAKWFWNDKPGEAIGLSGLRLQWNYLKVGNHIPRYTECAAVLGGCYCVPGTVWPQLGPWLDEFGLYGFGEQALSIKAYFLGIPRLCRSDVHTTHLFRVDRPYQMSGSYYWQSFAGATRILFSDEVWRAHFWPLIERIAGADPMIQKIRTDLDIAAKRDAFAPQKTRTDEECLQWLGITEGKVT